MVNQYVVIIDNRDGPKFQNLLYQNFSPYEKRLLKKYNSEAIWGFHDGMIKKEVWNNIKKNDIVFLTLPEENFKIYGIVLGTTIDSSFSINMWPDDIESKQVNHFIIFKKINKSNISYNELTQLTAPSPAHFPGIYAIKDAFKKIVKNSIIGKKTIPRQSKPKSFDFIKTSKIVAKKYKSEVTRHKRDPKLVKELKKLYHNKCQICNDTFEKNIKREFYSEAHHYNPVSKKGTNDWFNLIVVCPNHHARFDYGSIAINIDGKIIDRHGKETGETITFHKEHSLSLENIVSRLE